MERPKLRKVERFVQERDSEPHLILRDPLDLAEPVAMAPDAGSVLDLLDGSKTVAQIRQSLLMRGQADLTTEDLQELIDALDEGGWLESDRFRQRFEATLQRWLAEDPRPCSAAGLLYPDDPVVLRTELDAALGAASRWSDDGDVLGVLVPHSPLSMTRAVLDATLRDLPSPEALDLIVVLATCHAPGLTPYVVTDKRYATPLGASACPLDLIAALERRLPWIRREEIRHRQAHTAELAVLYLQYIYGPRCPPILAVLCGQSVLADESGDAAEQADRFIVAVEALTEGTRTLFWGSGELNHGGPAYGRPELDARAQSAMEAHDQACLQALARGPERTLHTRCTEATPHGRPSGGAVMHTLRRLLGARTRAEIAAYQSATLPSAVQGRAGLAGVRFR